MRVAALLSIFLAAALPVLAEDWSTTDGKTYKDVTVVGQEEDGVRINYDGGAGKVFYSDMPMDLLKRFGQDPATLAAKKKAADEELAQQQAAAAAAEAKLKAAQEAAAAANKAAGGNPSLPTSAIPHGNLQEVPPVGLPAAAGPQHMGPGGAKPGTTGANGPGMVANHNTPVNHPVSSGPVNPYPGAKYSYDMVLDRSYLDSLDMDLEPEGGTTGDLGAVVLRLATDGRDPQMPEHIEAIFLTSGTPARVANVESMNLVVNGKSTSLTGTAKKDTSVLPFNPPGYTSFDLTPDQARALRDSSTEINVGGTVYKVSQDGTSEAESYFATMSKLPPASPSVVKMFHKILASIPSFATMISAICGWVFLGAFGIFVTGFVVIMIIGIVRFINVG